MGEVDGYRGLGHKRGGGRLEGKGPSTGGHHGGEDLERSFGGRRSPWRSG